MAELGVVRTAGKTETVDSIETQILKNTRSKTQQDRMPGTGTDAASRASRRTWRNRLNTRSSRKLLLGTISTLVGGACWGFSGTCSSYLFQHYNVGTAWLMSVRQLSAGILFMIIAFAFERQRLTQLWTTKEDRRCLIAFALGGVLFNQFFYLVAVRLTNAGTATVLQCLQLILILVWSCLHSHRGPRRRETIGVALALAGTFLLATGGDPSQLSIPQAGLVTGLLCAVGAAGVAILPTRILPKYGSNVVTGSAMFVSGVLSSLVVQPWQHVPNFNQAGWTALAALVVIGSFVAYLLYMQGVKDVGSMRASLLGTIEPISATVLSALLLGTVFAPTDLLGFALIIAMVFLTA